MSLELAVQQNTQAIHALIGALAGLSNTALAPTANVTQTSKALTQASTPAPAAPPPPPMPPATPAGTESDDAPTYKDVTDVVQQFIKAGVTNKAKGRDAALAILSGFKDAKGVPLASVAEGKWTGSAKNAQASDYAAVIAAFKAVA